MKHLRIPLQIVFYKEEGDWVAHCLQFDLLGDGPTREEALNQLFDAIAMQVEASVENNNPENLFSPADGKYFEMFAAGKDIAVGNMEIRHIDSVELTDITNREYSETDADMACA